MVLEMLLVRQFLNVIRFKKSNIDKWRWMDKRLKNCSLPIWHWCSDADAYAEDFSRGQVIFLLSCQSRIIWTLGKIKHKWIQDQDNSCASVYHPIYSPDMSELVRIFISGSWNFHERRNLQVFLPIVFLKKVFLPISAYNNAKQIQASKPLCVWNLPPVWKILHEQRGKKNRNYCTL